MTPAETSQYVRITEQLLDLEVKNDFFTVEIRGIPVWERIRRLVHFDLLYALGALDDGSSGQTNSDPLPINYAKKIKQFAIDTYRSLESTWNFGQSVLWYNPYFAGNSDMIVYGQERRKKRDDGMWEDIYFDPLYNELESDYVHLERKYNRTHRKPAVTENLYHIDLADDIANLRRRLYRWTDSLNQQEYNKIENLENQINTAFDTEIDILPLIRDIIEKRQTRLPLYHPLLEKTQPEIALTMGAYAPDRQIFIEVCKRQGIPVVELQHGTPNRYQLGYSFPGSRESEVFPDYFFTFGEIWNSAATYPIADKNIIAVGYPYLEINAKQYEDVESKDQLLFISQWTIGRDLSQFAVEASECDEIEREIVYKLHPGEYSDWEETYPWLVDSSVTVIDSDDPPLYQLFAESDSQIGVYSTALCEGLFFDLQTFVYDIPMASLLMMIHSMDSVSVISTISELSAGLSEDTPENDTTALFKPNATENIIQALETVRHKHESDSA